MDDYRIVQLLPADGWQALFAVVDVELFMNRHETKYTHAELEPLIAWALVEWSDGRQRVVGLCREEYGTGRVVGLCREEYGTGIIYEETDFLGYFRYTPDDETIRYELALAQSIADDEAAEER